GAQLALLGRLVRAEGGEGDVLGSDLVGREQEPAVVVKAGEARHPAQGITAEADDDAGLARADGLVEVVPTRTDLGLGEGLALGPAGRAAADVEDPTVVALEANAQPRAPQEGPRRADERLAAQFARARPRPHHEEGRIVGSAELAGPGGAHVVARAA